MILVIGSANVDYVAFVDNAPSPGETVTGTRFATHGGGKGANQAFAAARLGAASTLVARVGRDAQGAWLKAHLAAAGVDTRDVIDDDEASTGVALIVVDRAGENSIVVAPGANGRLAVADVEARAELFSRRSRGAAAAGSAARHGDGGGDAGACAGLHGSARSGAGAPVARRAARPADYVTPNETELVALTSPDGEAARGRMPVR